MTHITITDLTKNEELDQQAMRAVCGGMFGFPMPSFSAPFQQITFGTTAAAIGGYGLQPTGNPHLDSMLLGFGNQLDQAVITTQGNPQAMFNTIHQGVSDYRRQTGLTWGGMFPGGSGLFF